MKMDEKRRRLLLTHRFCIVQDLDVAWIIDNLISGKAINNDQANFLLNLSYREDRVKTLLDMLPKNGNSAYDVFVDSLKKYYSWLWEKLHISESTPLPEVNGTSTLEDVLGRGDVPRMPPHYVIRTEVESKIKTALSDLQRHQMLVLCGMPGSGKSALAASALRNNSSLVLDIFKGNIYWLNVGDCLTDEQIVALQSRMHKKICTSDFYRDTSSYDTTSEMSLNASTSTYEEKWTDYKDKLKCAFDDENFKHSLIVIDDLRWERVAQAFDVGCRVLITTQDMSYLSPFHPVIVNVSESLTETESLQLMASCIGYRDISELPQQARKIHTLCQGAPLLMALLGGLMEENKERLRDDDTHWRHYVKQLKNKKNSFFSNMFKSSPNLQKPYLAIMMCVNSITDDNVVKLFKSLAVLPNNVKVPTKALSTILNKSEEDVENTMKQLKNKSLVIEYYDTDLKSYRYEIHDLIMSYLKSIYSEMDMKRLHISLIHRYKEVCTNNSLINLPDDGYIAYYIGYHLKQTGNLENMWNMFNELYTNLLFIGNKIRLAGSADVIFDFSKYCEHIIKKATDKELIFELTKFIQSHGYDLYHYPSTEIIQSIFQHVPQKGVLYDKAMSIAVHPANKDNLYFQFQCENSPEDDHYLPLDIRDTICVVKFWMEYVLIGNATGKIIMWSLPLNKKVRTFHGHEGAIKSISLDYKMSCKMATVGQEGSLKIWIISEEVDFNGYEDVDSIGIDDPVEDIFESVHTITCDVNKPFASSCWGHVSEILLAHTDPGGALVIYSADGRVSRKINYIADYLISSSILSLDDTLAICGYFNDKSASSKYGIHIYNSMTGDFVMSFSEKEYVLTLALVKDHPKCVLSLTKTHLNRHEWKHNMHVNESQAAASMKQVKIADLEVLKAEYTFQTGCVSADGLYMFVSTTDGHVLVYSLAQKEMVLELNNHRGKVTSIDSMGHWNHLDSNHIYSLITKSGDDVHTLKYWFLRSSELTLLSESKGKIKMSLKFDCVFDKHLNSPVITDYHYADYVGNPVKRAETMLDKSSADSSNNNSPKVALHKTLSLDRRSLRPLNLTNLSNLDTPCHPIISVVDRGNKKVQILRGKKSISIIETPSAKSIITTVAWSPCGQHLIYGTREGVVNLLFLKSSLLKKIMDLNDEIHYLEFVNDKLLVAASRTGGLMIYELLSLEESIAKMIVRCGVELGSQELINDFGGIRSKRSSDSTDRVKQPSPPPENNGNNFYRSDCSLLKQTIFVKCFWLDDIGLLSVASDGSVKRWNLDPQVLGIVIRKQTTFRVSCAALYKNIFMVLCDDTGKFQIYSLISDNVNRLCGILFDSNKVNSGITCSEISRDGKLLALGLDSGVVVLWHISSKAMVSALSLHKTKVRCLKFSPGPPLVSEAVPGPPVSPFAGKSFSFPSPGSPNSPIQEAPVAENNPPLVLVSLADQIVWWNVTEIMTSKIKHKRKSQFGSMYHLISPKSNSMMDFNTASENELASSVLKFSYVDNATMQWENMWRGKKAKENSFRKEIISCIKLVGDEAHQILADEKFSKFVTVDQSGNLYVMNVMENPSNTHHNNYSNGNGNGHTS